MGNACSPSILAHLQGRYLDAGQRFPWLWAGRIDATEQQRDESWFPFPWSRLIVLTNKAAILGPAPVLFAAAGTKGSWLTVEPQIAHARPFGVDPEQERTATETALKLAAEAAIAALGPSSASGIDGGHVDACRWLERLVENPTGRSYERANGIVTRATACGFFLESAQLLEKLSEAIGGGGEGADKTPAGNAKLKPSAAKAAMQYSRAVQSNAELKEAKDRDVYDWLKENLDEGELLPTFATWQRQLRLARQYSAARKNMPRNKSGGRSVVKQSEL